MEVDEETRVMLFRCVRELLFNVVKHARSASARVHLGRTGDGRVRIVVSDQGVGFKPEDLRDLEGNGAGFGLFSLRQRLELLGGRLDVDAAPGSGASFTIIGPPPRPEAAEAPPVPPVAPLKIAVRRQTGIRRAPPAGKKTRKAKKQQR